MCMIEDCDEPVQQLTDTWRKARKSHRCEECRRTIDPGERYHWESYVSDGRLEVVKTCSHCMVCRDWLRDECGGWVYGCVRDEIVEHAEEYPDRLKLKIMAIGIRRSWRRKDGKPWRMPVMPETSELLGRVRALAIGMGAQVETKRRPEWPFN